MTYCDICQSEQDERAIQYAEVMQTVMGIGCASENGNITFRTSTVTPDWGDAYKTISAIKIAACSDCIATHSDKEMTELLITIAEEN